MVLFYRIARLVKVTPSSFSKCARAFDPFLLHPCIRDSSRFREICRHLIGLSRCTLQEIAVHVSFMIRGYRGPLSDFFFVWLSTVSFYKEGSRNGVLSNRSTRYLYIHMFLVLKYIINLYKLYKILLEFLKCFTSLLKFLLGHMTINKKWIII